MLVIIKSFIAQFHYVGITKENNITLFTPFKILAIERCYEKTLLADFKVDQLLTI